MANPVQTRLRAADPDQAEGFEAFGAYCHLFEDPPVVHPALYTDALWQTTDKIYNEARRCYNNYLDENAWMKVVNNVLVQSSAKIPLCYTSIVSRHNPSTPPSSPSMHPSRSRRKQTLHSPSPLTIRLLQRLSQASIDGGGRIKYSTFELHLEQCSCPRHVHHEAQLGLLQIGTDMLNSLKASVPCGPIPDDLLLIQITRIHHSHLTRIQVPKSQVLRVHTPPQKASPTLINRTPNSHLAPNPSSSQRPPLNTHLRSTRSRHSSLYPPLRLASNMRPLLRRR
jgi:hypothetical protein